MELEKKYPIPTREEEDLQQALAVLWVQLEQGMGEVAQAESVLEGAVRPDILRDLVLGGFVF